MTTTAVPQLAVVTDIERMINAESPSDDAPLLARCASVVADIGTARLGVPPVRIAAGDMECLYWHGSPQPRVLLLGHYDTVWPAGTIDRWPVAVDGDRLTGPGAFDMKAGIVQGFDAVSRLADPGDVGVLLVGDEELGSPRSRPLIERLARDAECVLVLESSSDGALKTARKGSAFYRVDFTGVAAHAGLDPYAGANTISAATRWIAVAEALADRGAGTSVTVTTMHAGTAVNTVPAHAVLSVDVRAITSREQSRVDAALRSIGSTHDAVSIVVDGDIDRPPLESVRTADLMSRAVTIGAGLGMDISGVAVGGSSDGNFTAALGVPTLDGLGAVGGHAHAEGEWISLRGAEERTRLVAALMQSLLADPITAA